MLKKLIGIIICMNVANAIAADTDVFIASCPTCECDDAEYIDYNSYAGVRIYQNARASFVYNAPDVPSIKNEKDNLGFGTTMGLRFNCWLRGEYETLYMGAQYNANNQDFQYDLWANMFNAYLYWDFDHAIAPYIGGGIGLTAMWGATDGDLRNATKLSYQALVGVLFELGKRIELEAGFKYINFGKIGMPSGTTAVDATQFYLGAIYRFGT